MLWGGAAAGERGEKAAIRLPARLLDAYSHWFARWMVAYSHWFARLLDAYSHWLHLFDFSPMCVFKRGGAAAEEGEERAGDKLLGEGETN